MEPFRTDEITIPIPQYPKFKLRSSLIDKDPVIWVHLLESYIKLFQYLVDPPQNSKLSVRSLQDLQSFLKGYLSETSREANQIFSLGAINPDIVTNSNILRCYVFQFIKLSSIVKCGLLGESIWDFVTIYVCKNFSIVRQLIDGTFNSKLNEKKSGGISSINLIQKHLEYKVINEDFKDFDLDSLSNLLGQQIGLSKQTKISITNTSSQSQKTFDKFKPNAASNFAAKFVNKEWIQLLEKLYANGKSIHVAILRKIMIVSLISLTPALIKTLTDQLSINSIDDLKKYRLFGSILISDHFAELVPNLDDRLPWLYNFTVKTPVNEESIATIQELFPQISFQRAHQLLQKYDNNVESLTNELFENPDLLQDIPTENGVKSKESIANTKRSIYDGDKISNNDFSETKVILGKQRQRKASIASEDLKNKALAAALKLLYESDEDEPDDTYDDQEETTGDALGNDNHKRKKPEKSNSEGLMHPETDPKETYLFSFIRNKKVECLEKSGRKSKERKEIQDYTGWSHEQIEGWYRMLLKSPRRFKILEENYFFSRQNQKKIDKTPEPEPNAEEEAKISVDPTQKILEPSFVKRNPRAKKKTSNRNSNSKASK